MPKTLLFIAHIPSFNTRVLADATARGITNQDIERVELKQLSPLEVQPSDLLAADAILIATTENLGYMSGLTKDMFDRCYYPCLENTQGKPFCFYVRAGHDGTGTKRAIETITTGLRWRLVQEPLILRGEFKEEFTEQCEELGLSIAAALDAGII